MTSSFCLPIEEVLVPGQSASGAIRLSPTDANDPTADGILVVRTLNIENYHDVVRSGAVICENGQATNHMTVVCRILGIPVVRVQEACRRFATGQVVFIDIANRVITNVPTTPMGAASIPLPTQWPVHPSRAGLTYQASIVDDPTLVEKLNRFEGGDLEHFFLRSELIWVGHNVHPFEFLEIHGLDATVRLLADSLLANVERLKSGQKLNFRGLDMRSDQTSFQIAHPVPEANPQLGLHGTRALLSNPRYLAAELAAVDEVASRGRGEILYSLPFLTLSSEFREVLSIRNAKCRNRFPLGVFVETPAAVYEIHGLLEASPAAIYVGTKDLAQLILAADRDNSSVSYLLSMLREPVIKAIRDTVDAAMSQGVPVFVFALPHEMEALLTRVPQIRRISLAAADYLVVTSQGLL